MLIMCGDYTDLDSEGFDKFISDEKAIVYFWAPWCGPCKVMGPEFEKAAKELKDKFEFAKVNVDDNQELAQRFQVMSIPTTIFFNGPEQVNRANGALSKEEIVEKVDEDFFGK